MTEHMLAALQLDLMRVESNQARQAEQSAPM